LLSRHPQQPALGPKECNYEEQELRAKPIASTERNPVTSLPPRPLKDLHLSESCVSATTWWLLDDDSKAIGAYLGLIGR